MVREERMGHQWREGWRWNLDSGSDCDVRKGGSEKRQASSRCLQQRLRLRFDLWAA
ncbi:hypothetical protein TIFTF001_048306 [Ficus carica]|uniref:Uncharacterized protein n=1 Tax=Ficus carica TaxID=3494 RepID=A0AA87ZY61_FICCA|nr:hypothetical protein TIFTF001_048306 [Ficus carica]